MGYIELSRRGVDQNMTVLLRRAVSGRQTRGISDFAALQSKNMTMR